MDAFLYGLLAATVVVPVAGIMRVCFRGEPSPEREPDVSDEERAYLAFFAKTNKWDRR